MLNIHGTADAILTNGRAVKAHGTGLVDCIIVALGGLAVTLILIHQGILPAAMQLPGLQ